MCAITIWNVDLKDIIMRGFFALFIGFAGFAAAAVGIYAKEWTMAGLGLTGLIFAATLAQKGSEK